MLNDGESISPISSRIADSIYPMVVSGRAKRCLGYFRRDADAISILSHTVFHPDGQTKYEIREEEDLSSKKTAEGNLSDLKNNT